MNCRSAVQCVPDRTEEHPNTITGGLFTSVMKLSLISKYTYFYRHIFEVNRYRFRLKLMRHTPHRTIRKETIVGD